MTTAAQIRVITQRKHNVQILSTKTTIKQTSVKEYEKKK